MTKKILIVEDEQEMRTMLTEAFAQAGYDIIEASNGKEGLEAALQYKPDIILADLMMPVMDGLTMIKKLKEDEWGKTVPVTILTNSNESSIVADVIALGVHKYIVKADIVIEDIVRRISKELNI